MGDERHGITLRYDVEIRTADVAVNSLDSRIEVAFIQGAMTLYSTSSLSLLV